MPARLGSWLGWVGRAARLPLAPMASWFEFSTRPGFHLGLAEFVDSDPTASFWLVAINTTPSLPFEAADAHHSSSTTRIALGLCSLPLCE